MRNRRVVEREEQGLNERVGERIALDLIDAIEDLHGGDVGVVEHQRRAELGEAPDEDDGAASEESGPHEREGDAAEDRPSPRAKIGGGLLHRGIDVAERREHVLDGLQEAGVGPVFVATDSEAIAEVVSRIKEGGYDVFLVLEATIGVSKQGEKSSDKTSLVTTLSTNPEFKISEQDLKFLKSLRIKIDEEK